MQPGGAKDQTTDLLLGGGHSTLPPEPQPLMLMPLKYIYIYKDEHLNNIIPSNVRTNNVVVSVLLTESTA